MKITPSATLNLNFNLPSLKSKWIIWRIYIPEQIISSPVLACFLKSSETLLYEANLWRKTGSGDIQALSCHKAGWQQLSVVNSAACMKTLSNPPLFCKSALKQEHDFAEEVKMHFWSSLDNQTHGKHEIASQNTTVQWVSQASPLASVGKWVTTSHACSLLAAAQRWRRRRM